MNYGELNKFFNTYVSKSGYFRSSDSRSIHSKNKLDLSAKEELHPLITVLKSILRMFSTLKDNPTISRVTYIKQKGCDCL